MALIAWIVLFGVAVVAVVAFFQRFYRKSSRDMVLIRTGAGGQKIVFDGGCFALPMLHRVDEVSMRTQRLVVERAGQAGLLTADRLRVEASMEFRVRVASSTQSVATAVQAYGARVLRSDELGKALEGRFIDAMQRYAAEHTLDELHLQRGVFAASVRDTVAEEFHHAGLMLEAVSLLHLDQTPLATLNEDNVFNAVGMRKLAEIVAENKKSRAATQADAEVAVAQTQVIAAKRRLELSAQEQQAQIEQELALERSRAHSEAARASVREEALQAAGQAAVAREQTLAAAQIARDHALEQSRMESQLQIELQRVAHAIDLAQRQEAEAVAAVSHERARTLLALEQERGLTERARTTQSRQHELALARVAEESEVDAAKTQTETARTLALARAEAQAQELRAQALHVHAAAETQAQASRIAADNTQSAELMRMKLELARLEALPALAEKVAAPLQKIESIRINHLSGLGERLERSPNAETGAIRAETGPIDAIYDMALHLPVLKRLGEMVGADLDMNVPQLARAESDHSRADAEHRKTHPAANAKSSSD